MLVFRFGWAKPVPVDMRNFKNPKTGMAITAIAGPLSNIALAALVLFVYGLVFMRLGGRTGGADRIALEIIERTAYLSVALAIFNLIPIPPLDGSKVLFSFLSERTYYKLMRYERYGMILLIIVLNTNLFRSTIGRLTMELFNRLAVVAQVAFDIVN
jgi:Zn-dependent protease